MKSTLLKSMTLILVFTVILVVIIQKTAQTGAPAFSALDMAQYPKKGTREDYLTRDNAPDSLALLPAPPEEISPTFKADIVAFQEGLKLRTTARGELATRDANLAPEALSDIFTEVLEIKLSPQTTPVTYNLIYRMGWDLGGYAVYDAKHHYNRARPFMYYNITSCQPDDEAGLRKDGSYPSGHAAMGWGWALILAEIVPERKEKILQRGLEYGQSRVICGAHWQSDVDAGLIIGAATVSRLHSEPKFASQLEAAKQELAIARQKSAAQPAK
ncbi:MAG: Acid phosphatase [Candidatus Tokpelaia hoelldobleri]|uniref:Acid phosphatase n=1 Tax=Candidatus Tokpelaia hoelldobleri TaxID=1902579 RepID=A0A1U9JUU0_9HYPH|nr:MAG: Acid phosphatase [Candidatus Tokpelaia hoelldoblerii]